MTDIGPHMLDVAMWITECSGPKSVVCNGGNYHYPRWETPDNQKSAESPFHKNDETGIRPDRFAAFRRVRAGSWRL